MDSTLQTFVGSLLLDDTTLVAAYDLESLPLSATEVMPLKALRHPGIENYALRPFTLDFMRVKRLCVINGMGVTLGDSLIGIAALQAIKTINPDIHLTVLRPHTCPAYVEDIYQLANKVIDDLRYLPAGLSTLQPFDALIDAGNQLFRDDFASMEMHDFFLRHLGIAPETVAPELKTNRWLREAITDRGNPLDAPYILFNHRASTPLRNIPDAVLSDFIEHIYRQHGILVAGFGAIAHPQYIDISARSQTTQDFIAAVQHASRLYTCDSSALHIAAAFNVPTVCYFNAIKPSLRAAYYPLCESLDMATKHSELLHQSEDRQLLSDIEANYWRYLSAS